MAHRYPLSVLGEAELAMYRRGGWSDIDVCKACGEAVS